MRMSSQESYAQLGRTAFLSIGALSIRRILVEHHRARLALRRGGDRERVPIFDSVAFVNPQVDLLAPVLHRQPRAVLRLHVGVE